MTITILTGDCREVLRGLPAESVHCVVTSPPYWRQAPYDFAGNKTEIIRQIGQAVPRRTGRALALALMGEA